MQDITTEQLKEKLEQAERDFLFLDVREPWEYEESNLKAKLIPLGDLPGKLNELEEYKEKEILIHCRSGARSGQAKEFLSMMGFTQVRNVLGGIMRWEELYGKPS